MKKLFFSMFVLLNFVVLGQQQQWTVVDYNGIDSLGWNNASNQVHFYFKTSLTSGSAAITYEAILPQTFTLQNDQLLVKCRVTGGSVHLYAQLYNNLNPSVGTNIVSILATGIPDVYLLQLPAGIINVNRLRLQFGYFPYEYGTRNIYVDKIYTTNGVVLINPVTTDIDEENLSLNSFKLMQNYPNPFNPSTKISVQLAQTEKLNINVYNTIGQLVATLANGEFAAGIHTFEFNAANLPSGVYICKANNKTIKMALLK